MDQPVFDSLERCAFHLHRVVTHQLRDSDWPAMEEAIREAVGLLDAEEAAGGPAPDEWADAYRGDDPALDALLNKEVHEGRIRATDALRDA